MNVLVIHQNFPGQFKHLAPALVARGDQVVAMTLQENAPATWHGIRLVSYSVRRGTGAGVHPWVADFETKVIRAEACFNAARALLAEGFMPDLILAHPGWGESLFLKTVWPHAKLALYSEFFYNAQGADVGFDPEFPVPDRGLEVCRLRLKNLNQRLHFDEADAGLSPTHWQASLFPSPFRERISVIHDGVDTQRIRPDPKVVLRLKTASGELVLTRDDEVITFVNRHLEPYRGYHTFMRSLPTLLSRRPRVRVLIVGGNDVSYGSRPPSGGSWKDVFINEVRNKIPDADWARVHFLGNVPYAQFIPLLQLSRVHVYLTYPFVLSWSLLEAMSAGCAIVGSSTAPVREVITEDDSGRLVDFFDPLALVDTVIDLLNDPQARARLGQSARARVQANYDLQSVCLPRQLAWVDSLLP